MNKIKIYTAQIMNEDGDKLCLGCLRTLKLIDNEADRLELELQKCHEAVVMSSRLRREIEKVKNFRTYTPTEISNVVVILEGVLSAISCEEISET